MLTMVAALVLVLCTFVTGAMADTTMYVRTGNGKTLNVRSEPNTGDNVIYRFQYGQEVTVAYHLGNGWSCVRLAGAFDQDGYVMTKFLVNEKPGKYVPSSADAELAQPAHGVRGVGPHGVGHADGAPELSADRVVDDRRVRRRRLHALVHAGGHRHALVRIDPR